MKNKIFLALFLALFFNGCEKTVIAYPGNTQDTDPKAPEGAIDWLIGSSDDGKGQLPDRTKRDLPDGKPMKEENLSEKCWKGYEKKGMKTMFGKRYPNCVKKTKKEEAQMLNDMTSLAEDDMKGMSVKSGDKRSVDQGAGMTKKGVEKYRRKNPGSKLSTAVTTPPSKLDPDSKAAKRRKSFCARSRSWTGERGKAARKRWNC